MKFNTSGFEREITNTGDDQKRGEYVAAGPPGHLFFTFKFPSNEQPVSIIHNLQPIRLFCPCGKNGKFSSMMTSEMTMTMLMVAEFCKKNYRDRDSAIAMTTTIIL